MRPDTADDIDTADDRAGPDDAELYQRVSPELIRFATALVGRGDAPDVLSGAVVKALGTPGWPAVANRRAYLYRAVFNEAQTWLRTECSTASPCPPNTIPIEYHGIAWDAAATVRVALTDMTSPPGELVVKRVAID
jgi:DNA-directed RNA polymerase specialized sigma24 family protein